MYISIYIQTFKSKKKSIIYNPIKGNTHNSFHTQPKINPFILNLKLIDRMYFDLFKTMNNFFHIFRNGMPGILP